MPRLLLATLLALVVGPGGPHAAAQTPAAPAAAADTAVSLRQSISNLGNLDFPTRMQAARLIRRAPPAQAVPALTEAARHDSNEFVRYRALIILTGFLDPGTHGLMRELMRDPNDRVREVVYKWLEGHPDPQLAGPLLASLQTEQSEFVRPALVAAIAALGSDPVVQRALVAESSRGLDFFRSAVIEAFGRYRATYALDSIAAASKLEGPLQDDAVLALGRLGDAKARAALKAVTSPTGEAAAMMHAALCLVGEPCAEHIAALRAIVVSENVRNTVVRAAVDSLGAIAQSGNDAALTALVGAVQQPSAREFVALGFAGVALRQPDVTVAWIEKATPATRETAIGLLKDGFDSLEEDYAEEQFFAAVRAGYWRASDASPGRSLRADLIQRLEF